MSKIKADRETLREIWETVLGHAVNTDQDFFTNGGDSYLATLLIAQIQKKCNILIELGDVFFDSSFESILGYMNNGAVSEEVSANASTIENNIDSNRMTISSLNQENLYVIEMQNKNLGNTYNMPVLTKIKGEVDLERLKKACELVFSEEEMLRTYFHMEGSRIYQLTHQDKELPFSFLEIEYQEFKANKESYLKRFNLEKDVLIQIILITDSKTKEHYLFVNQHHIISDGVSVNLVLKHIADAYAGTYQKSEYSYLDFAKKQRDDFSSGKYDKSKEYWKQQFKDGDYELDFPVDKTRPEKRSFAGARKVYEIDETLIQSAKELAIKCNTTLYTVMFAAFAVVLKKLTGKDEFSLGSTAAGRDTEETSSMLGLFITTLPILFRFNEKSTFQSVIEDLKNTMKNTYKHLKLPYSEILKELGVAGNMQRSPLLDAGFLFQNMENEAISLGDDISFEPYEYLGSGCRFELMMEINKVKGKTIIIMEYCTDLFTEQTMKRIADIYCYILEQIASDCTTAIADLCLLDQNHTKQMFDDYQGDVKNIDGKCLLDLYYQNFNEQKRAVVMTDSSMTYKELNQKSDCLAAYLTANFPKGSVIGVKMKRDSSLLTAYLGILKAGYTFLPIDPENTLEKIRYMCDLGDAKLVLTNDDSVEAVMNIEKDIDEILAAVDVQEFSVRKPDPQDAAYILFTSGSTGASKGVAVPYEALYNFAISMYQVLDMNSIENVLALTTISFDISLLELLVPLLFGKTVVLVSREEQLQNKRVNQLIQREQVDFIQMTPSRLKLFLCDGNEYFKQVSKILIGGEMPFSEDIAMLKSNTDADIYNMYGPTETTIWSSVSKIEDPDKITAGKPILNTKLFVLDKDLTCLPTGIPGDLYIGGQGLAIGYMKNPKETESKFLQYLPKERKEAPQRIYKTGDMAKWTEDGEIVILGRNDNQIKLNGYRIEIDDIRDCVLKVPEITNAVILCMEDHLKVKHLNCYYTGTKKYQPEEINRFLRKHISQNILPTHYIYLEEFPLNLNGKVDVNKLKQIEIITEEKESHVLTDLQKKIKAIWSNLLEKDDIDLHDSFYDLGGNSLLAIRFSVELEKQGIIGEDEDIDMFTYNTIKKISDYLEEL